MKFLLFFVIPGALYGQMLAAIGSNERPMGTRYLSDLRWISSTNGFGPVERDTSNGEDLALDGVVQSIRGNTYTKGIGAHAASDIRINLGGACTQFTATVGIDDEVSAWPGAVVFQVWKGGGTKLYDSGTLNAQSSPVNVSVDIKGVNEMRLIVVGVGPNSNHADWALASVVCNGTPPPAAVSVTTSSLPAGTAGTAYSQALTAAGGVAPYTWSITSGSLPGGITLAPSTGIISGTTATVGAPSITFKATDTLGGNGSRALTFTINAADSGPPAGSINVISGYGAVGNGIHDDTTNINNAIAACAANSQKTVYFPTGNYKITGTLTLGVSGCTLWGDRNASTITATGSANPMLHASVSNVNTTIKNLIWDCNNIGEGLKFNDVSTTGLVVTYNKIINVGSIAVHIGDADKSGTRDESIDHNIIVGTNSITSGMKCVRFEGHVADTHVDNNYFDFFYQGVEKPAGTGAGNTMSISNNTFIRGQRAGIEFMSTQNNATIANNWFGQWRQCQTGTSECNANYNGFGNWFVFSQLISWASGGTGHDINGNFLQCGDGMANGIEWSPVDSGSKLRNNIIKTCTVSTYFTTPDGVNYPDPTKLTGNSICTPYDSYGGYSNAGFWASMGTGNHFYNSCSAVGMPADTPTPPLPF